MSAGSDKLKIEKMVFCSKLMNPDEVGSFIVMIVTVAVGAVMASKSTGCFFKGLAFFSLRSVCHGD